MQLARCEALAVLIVIHKLSVDDLICCRDHKRVSPSCMCDESVMNPPLEYYIQWNQSASCNASRIYYSVHRPG